MKEKKSLSICVLGLGYIGLPTAAILASKGIMVTGVDVNPEVIDTINSGNIHIFEPHLADLVSSSVNSGYLRAALKPCCADVYIIAVPTPFKEGKLPDLTYVEGAALSISPMIEKGNLVILESTSPVGTTELVARIIYKNRPDLAHGNKILFAHCPERVLPGKIVYELVHNNRIVGGMSQQAALEAKEVYQTFVEGDILLTDARTAEMAKLTENAFRDVNIAFANELSLICDRLGIDVWNLIELANKHPRVNILQPGPGVGGHCIAVDPWFIVDSAPNQARLIRTAREVNDYKPLWVVDRIIKEAEKLPADAPITFLGLSYKNDIDDLRESPAVEIVRTFCNSTHRQCLVVEPNIKELPLKLKNKKNVHLCDLDKALVEGDLIVLLVNHREFYSIETRDIMHKCVIDTRGMWRGEETDSLEIKSLKYSLNEAKAI